MNVLYYIAPFLLVVFSNTMYHIISKSTSSSVDPFAALIVTYGMAFLGSTVLFLLTKKTTVWEELSNLKAANYIMGLVIIGLEGGYMLMYQKGWQVSTASLACNICVAVILLFVGALLWKEPMNTVKLAGIVLCLAGIILVNIS